MAYSGKSSNWLRNIVIVLALGGVGAAVVSGMKPKLVNVESALVAEGPMKVTVIEDGHARVINRYTISAPISGKVARSVLKAGDSIESGEVVARVVPVGRPLRDARSMREAEARLRASEAGVAQAKAQIERSKASFAIAKDNYSRKKSLYSNKAISVSQLDTSRSEMSGGRATLEGSRFAAKVAEHEMEAARAALGHVKFGKFEVTQTVEKKLAKVAGSLLGGATEVVTEIVTSEDLQVTSPINGRVLKVFRESEGAVAVGAPLLEVGDPRALELVVDVLTNDAVHIQPGAQVEIRRWGGPDLNAHVARVEPSAFTRNSALGVEEQRVNVIIELDDAYENWMSLSDGYRVEADIAVWRSESVTRIPASALFRKGEDWAVFVVDGNEANVQVVDIGQRNAGQAQVLSGLSVDQRVVVHPSDKVKDGVLVSWDSDD